ncbi:MAG: SDR family oxidoreductase [Thermomicrobiales bacterium]
MIDPGLRDKVVLVTGANSAYGIGAAIALAFVSQSATVFITYLRQSPERFGIDPHAARSATMPGEPFYRAHNADAPTAVLEQARALGGHMATAECDLADPAMVPLLFDRVEATLGPVEVLINNAAHSVSDRFLPTPSGTEDETLHAVIDASSHDAHFAVNSRAVALTMAEYARRHLLRGATWGRIVNISTEGADSFPGEISYGASKAALESYSRAAAIELAPLGITVNIVAPGPIQTGWISAETASRIAEETPLGRVGAPQDVADVVLFLASEQARWVTGQRLFVGGGHRIV